MSTETQERPPGRDPARIQQVLITLEHYWRRNPQLRLGQIVGNAASRRHSDPYFIEDDSLREVLESELAS